MDGILRLRLFRSIATLGSFAAAARGHSLSPAAVSKAMSELESDLGARLFHRTTRRLSLTEAGTLYLDQIRRVLEDLEEAQQSVGNLSSEPSGLLRVSAPMTSSLVLITSRIPGFLARYPAVSLDLDLDDRRVDLVRDGFDMALRGGRRDEDRELIVRKLGALKHVLCASPAYIARAGMPQEPADLARHECIRFTLSGHADEWTFFRNRKEHRQRVTGRYKVSSSLAVMDALHAGFGLSLIPQAYVAADLAAGTLVRLLPEWDMSEVTINAVYPSRRHVPAKVRAFAGFIAEVLRETLRD